MRRRHKKRSEEEQHAQEGKFAYEQDPYGRPMANEESTKDAEQAVANATPKAMGSREENSMLNRIRVDAEGTHPKNHGAMNCRKGGKKAKQATVEDLPTFKDYMKYREGIKPINKGAKWQKTKKQITLHQAKDRMEERRGGGRKLMFGGVIEVDAESEDNWEAR